MSTTGRSARTCRDESVSALWTRYKDTGARDARDQPTFLYQPLVRSVAARVSAGLPRHVDRGDLESFGLFGLFDAIEKFDKGRGYRLETYAITRIKGAILDELRALDWVPRSMRARAHAVERAESELRNRLHRSPSDDELIEELGVGRAEFQRTKALVSAGRAGLFEDRIEITRAVDDSATSTRATDPYEDVDARESLTGALSGLSRREHEVVVAYYFDSMTLAEIGAHLGVTESRVCQIHRHAIGNIRARLERADRRLAVG